ncbi:hypothetical protein B0O99DRAFT_600350 [Bisporella sp. PMI_857]|nr:hypothetical protein B0O99DRAFT_600350 [Bisporella sp. PMI_857]
MLSTGDTIALALGHVAILVAIINLWMNGRFAIRSIQSMSYVPSCRAVVTVRNINLGLIKKLRVQAEREASDSDIELGRHGPSSSTHSLIEDSLRLDVPLPTPPHDNNHLLNAVSDALDAFSRLVRSHRQTLTCPEEEALEV